MRGGALQRLSAWFVALLGVACASAGAVGVTPEPSPSPVAPPGVGASGCVESEDLKAFVAALDQRRVAARDAALEALGARPEQRRGTFFDPATGARLDAIHETNGKRWAVLANYASGFEPTVVPLAKQGAVVRRIDERPRAHGVPVRACGVQACPALGGRARSEVRPVGIELGAGETLADPLVVTYDYWWADVSYSRAARCSEP